MSEPKPGQQYEVKPHGEKKRSVQMTLSVEWARAVTRLQQLHNEGCTVVRMIDDQQGSVIIEPNE